MAAELGVAIAELSDESSPLEDLFFRLTHADRDGVDRAGSCGQAASTAAARAEDAK